MRSILSARASRPAVIVVMRYPRSACDTVSRVSFARSASSSCDMRRLSRHCSQARQPDIGTLQGCCSHQ